MPSVRTKLVLACRLALVAGVAVASQGLAPSDAHAQDCSDPDPSTWPAPAKPYFLVVVDTSGSMIECTAPNTENFDFPETCPTGTPLNSCSLYPSRINDAKCALRNTVQAFSGQVNFGLATYAPHLSSCGAGACVSDCQQSRPGTCFLGNPTTDTGCDCRDNNSISSGRLWGDDYNCTYNQVGPAGFTTCGFQPACTTGNGNGPAAPNFAEGAWRNGGRIVVPMKRDAAGVMDNTAELLGWFDGSCDGDDELFAEGATPLAGSLQTAGQYLRAGWNRNWNADNYCATGFTYTDTSPIAYSDPGCRPINIILVTDGDESCEGDPASVAADLFQNGVTRTSAGNPNKNWPIRTYVINFAGGSIGATNAIAAAGGTGSALIASDEASLATQLSSIISGSIAPETCDHDDNNCNGCIDEGYQHYCNRSQTCCAWGTQAQYDQCEANYIASLSTMPPDGNPLLLPCATASDANNPNTWLCYNPGDECDDVDNNCDGDVDEAQNKCGPVGQEHCPLPETCNGQDDNCDNQVDNGGVCGATCQVSPEICDGCDNDCDGVADEGIAPQSCGLASPANCAGTITCQASAPVATPGGCKPGAPGNFFNTCSNNPQAETCDGIDNDCDGTPDDSVPPTQCVPAGTPPNLNYGPNSQCRRGTQPCNGVCSGFIGPSTEICDGIDNDCDGQVDEAVPQTGIACGTNTGECVAGLTACVNGALVCQGGVGPAPERCNGLDDNCNAQTDEAPLADAPAPGMNGCWNNAGNCCTHGTGPGSLSWCAPPGATCNGVGGLGAPCAAGTLACVSGSWACQGGTLPVPEACDGVDNDCVGGIDNGTFPTEGQVCGTDVGPCQTGLIDCQAGVLDCIGDIPPGVETCNNIDDNCNGETDEGLPIMGECLPDYDEAAYPTAIFELGDTIPCNPGHFECDGAGGLVCVGGVGPTPELCDGIDNDCDGSIDEAGPPPQGINGSDNPLPGPEPPADATIGGACGTNAGECTEGQWACSNGVFICAGQQGPQVEECDCSDNDCNGVQDNENPGNSPPLCGEGQNCVVAAGACQCAAECDSGEFPCPAGQICQQVTDSETGRPLGNYCIVNNCNDCPNATTTDVDGNELCAPRDGNECGAVPECVCKGQSGCQAPCFGVTCDAPNVCAPTGEHAGECVVSNCFNLGCSCGEVCNDAATCVANPCDEDTCPNQVCKPSDDFSTFTCVDSCADVDCRSGEICVGGECVPTCDPACGPGQFCDMTEDPPACEDSLCADDACPTGGCCDPVSGACGACPCEGVICPDEQTCQNGECFGAGTGGEGGGGGGAGGEGAGTEGGGGSTGEGAGDTGGSGASSSDDSGVWGLATGGGGCACDVGQAERSRDGLAMVGLAIALAAARLKRRTSRARDEEVSR